MNLSTEIIISSSMDFLFIFLFCFLGAITKDTYNTLAGKEPKVNLKRIVISTIVSSIVIFSISDYLAKIMNWKTMILPCFVGGTIGFQMLEKISKLSFWVKIIAGRKEEILGNIKDEIDKAESADKEKKDKD